MADGFKDELEMLRDYEDRKAMEKMKAGVDEYVRNDITHGLSRILFVAVIILFIWVYKLSNRVSTLENMNKNSINQSSVLKEKK